MSPRWNWDFEDEPRGARMRAPSPPAPPRVDALQLARRTRFRRRRGAAAVAVALVVALIVVALSGSHHQAAISGSGARARALRAQALTPRARDTQADEDHAVASVLAYTPFVREGTARVRDIALTFDDGPGPYTPGVLSVLEQAHVRATFFAIGKMERYFSESTAREIRDGDVVGDHTESHPFLARLSPHEQREELFEQIARIELLGGPRPDLFRPPYGSFNATTLRQLQSLHLLMVLWSVDTGDYAQPGVPAIVQRVLAGAHPGAILLMHDGGGDRSQTIAALPVIIRELRARGFHLVTVPQLLIDDPPPRGQLLPPNLSGD
ncbi:MAG: polysaccharide deacetylase family protein [Solirubrobacterales bacterium]